MLPRPAASGTRHFAPAVEWGPPVHASGTSPERSLGQGRQTLEAVAAVEGSSAGEVRSSQPADRTAGAPLTRLGARSTTLPRLYAATADPGVGGCPGEPSRSAGWAVPSRGRPRAATAPYGGEGSSAPPPAQPRGWGSPQARERAGLALAPARGGAAAPPCRPARRRVGRGRTGLGRAAGHVRALS